MNDILDTIYGAPEPFPLDNLIPQALSTAAPPVAAVRNRAATVALLDGNPTKAIEKYQSMVAEGQEGSDTQATAALDAFHQNDNTLDMKAVMGVLADPSLTVDQKRGAIDAVKGSPLLRDSGTSLLTKNLEAGSSGETMEAESARISTADALNEIYKSKEMIQGLVNAHGASLDSTTGTAAVDMYAAVLAPFATSARAYKMAKAIAEANGQKFTAWDAIKAATVGAGSVTMDARKQLESLSPAARVEYAKTLVDVIQKNSGLLFANDNQYAQYMKATQIFDEGGYSDTEKFIDNVTFLLDAVGVGQLVRGGKAVKTLTTAGKVAAEDAGYSGRFVKGTVTDVPYDETVKRIEVNSVVRREHPASAASTAQQSNPEKARAFHEGAFKSTDDAFPEAAYGTSKEQAIINDVFPQATTATGNVTAKVADIQRNLRLDENLTPRLKQMLAESDVAIHYSLAEKAQARANIIRDYSSATDLVPVDAMGGFEAGFKLDGSGLKISAVYGTAEGAFVNAQQAYQQALFGLRNQGILPSEVEILAKQGMDYVPVDMQSVLKATPSVKTGYVRAYHGGVEAGQNGNLWFTTDFKNVEGWARNSKGKIFYVDLPSTHPSVKSDAEFGTLPPQNFELGSEYASLKRDFNPQLKEGSYLVRINTERMIDPTDITKFEQETVKRNFFDRSPGAVFNQNGSVSRWIFDAASMVSPRYTGSAVVATDLVSHFEKEMLHIADAYAKQFNSLPKVRKAKVDEYVREANFKGLPFDQADLIGRGFNADEVSTLRSWRDFWDSHFYLENHDAVRTLNGGGFQMFKTQNTELYAKAITKNSTIEKIYDPATGVVRRIDQAELDDLYNKGGTLARLRRPTEFSFTTGTKPATAVAEHMIVRNTPTEYLRKFRDTDQILNYREGYYQIQYNAPRFVDEIVRDAKGNITERRAIAVAGDTAEAEHFATRMRTQQTGKEYIVRGDDKAVRRGSDDWFDLNSASGRIAQKHRGKLLEDATGMNHLGDGAYIVPPVESAIRAAKSISGRTVTRPMLETAKARFISQYGDLLESNGYGGKVFPSTPGAIGEKGKQFAKRTADARTTWEYIHYLENGYINSIDEFFKQQFNALATVLGDAGYGRTERALLKAGEAVGGPTTLAKNLVFQAYIATNPLRQWITQTSQVTRTFAYNPMVWLSGNMARFNGEYVASLISGNQTDFTRFINGSGLMQSVDKQNLIRGSLLQAVDSSNRAVRMAGEAATLPRRIGFDIGESVNLLGHGAAVFDKYKRAGKDVTDVTVMREMHSELRAISYDMNFAGDMVYNQTSPAAVLQFMQVPHKAFLQATNRRIGRAETTRMLLADVALYGAPVAMISAVLGGDILSDDPKVNKAFNEGLQSIMLNHVLSELAGEAVNVDFSSLSPENLDGWAKIFHGMFGEGLSQVLMNSPAGQMFLNEGGRFQNAISTMARYFSPWEPGERTNEEAIMVANEVAKISSGWANAEKMRTAMALQKSLDKKGNVIDPSVNNTEAVMMLFGFNTQDTRKYYEDQRTVREGTKKHQEMVMKKYNAAKQYMQNKFESGITDPTQMQAVVGMMLMEFKDSPVAMGIIQKELSKDLVGKDQQLYMYMLKSLELPKYGLSVDQIKQSGVPEEMKAEMIKRLIDAQNVRKEINKDK